MTSLENSSSPRMQRGSVSNQFIPAEKNYEIKMIDKRPFVSEVAAGEYVTDCLERGFACTKRTEGHTTIIKVFEVKEC